MYLLDYKGKIYQCIGCGKRFINKQSYCAHSGSCNKARILKGKNLKNNESWCKGKNKFNDERIAKRLETFKINKSLGKHKKRKNMSNELKIKISNSMKLAHKEKRAWNIGKSRNKNLPSYPEIFFMKVIENEFIDKNYQREFPFSIYSLDFAWKHKMKCIEIDGCQHERFKEYKERDMRKDKLLKDNGWEILRIRWIDLFNNTKTWINIAKNFIDY